MPGRYDKMTTEEFDKYLVGAMEEYTMESILRMPGVYEVLSEYLNNEVLERWEEDNPEPDKEE